ncbi:MAG: hypothetical protein ABMB14_02565 [Myxococcota bacterium]
MGPVVRFGAVGAAALVLASCGAKYKPGDPVISGYDRAVRFPVARSHEGLSYIGAQPATPAPIIPILAFGAAFDLDFVVMPKEGDFSMLEYARIALPSGPQWIALESSAASGDQTLIANLDDIWSFMPEIPLARQSANLQVTDRSTDLTADVSISYPNSKGQQTEVKLTGDPPTKAARHRNGNTFDHSANQLIAVLDIPSQESLFEADVSIDGRNIGFKKIAAIVPAQFVLEQAQGGFAIGNYKVIPTDASVGGAGLDKVVVNTAGGAPQAKPSPEMQVKMGVAQNAASVKKCWTDRWTAQNDLKGGRMVFAFKVDAGKVSEPASTKIEGDDVFADEALAACVTGAVGAWSFDPSVTGTVSWPFTFVPGDTEAETDPDVKLGVGETQLAAAVEEAPVPVATDPAAVAPAPAPAEVALAISNFSTVQTLADGSTVELKWLVSQSGDRVTARQTTEVRSLVYEYRLVHGSFLELVTIQVEQYGRATPVTAITFNPPLPDLRWPFGGPKTSAFVIDVNGQQNHAYGEAVASWTETGPKLVVTPTAPDWAASRPMQTSIKFAQDGTAELRTERITN